MGSISVPGSGGGASNGPVPTSTQAGTAYTLALADAQSVVELTNAAAVTVTVPPASSVAWAVGTVIAVFAAGAGGVTIAPGGGVTIRNNQSPLSQYAEVSLRYRGGDVWVRTG